MGNQGPKTGMEGQGSLPLFLPALLMLSACLLARLRVEAHIPFLSLGTFSPERAALLGDLAWSGEGREAGEEKKGGQTEIPCSRVFLGLPQRRVVWMWFGAFPGAIGLGRAQPQRRGTSP